MKKHIITLGVAFGLTLLFSILKGVGLIQWGWVVCVAPLIVIIGIYTLLTVLGLIVIFFDKKFQEDIKDLEP